MPLLSLHIRVVVVLARMLKSCPGEGTADEHWIAGDALDTSPPSSSRSSPRGERGASFAPKRPTLQSRASSRLPQPLRVKIPNKGPVGKIHEVCSVGLIRTGWVGEC